MNLFKKILRIIVLIFSSFFALIFLTMAIVIPESKILTTIITIIFILIAFLNYTKLRKASVSNSKITELENTILELNQKLEWAGYPDYENLKRAVQEKQKELDNMNQKIHDNNSIISSAVERTQRYLDQEKSLEKKIATLVKKLDKLKAIYESVNYSIENYRNNIDRVSLLDTEDLEVLQNLSPNVILKLHHLDIKDLKKAFKDNDKHISNILADYESKYTTKANKTIYELLVIALRSELQNILYNLKYEKLEQSISNVQEMTAKYLYIAGNGNQTIVPTLTKFIGEIEYFFINSVKIEYNYYVKKEQQKQEQIALREQMRQEAEERKALELEKKKIEQEEKKFNTEIEKLQIATSSTNDTKELEALNARILELQSQLADVTIKRNDIAKLQNGKAGNVYIISNLGSFGNNVFKVGMTRRLDPQDRVNELGSASVPFKFDVHSFIFSEDAVSLETSLHHRLNKNRVNKVNLRKEFFRISIDELENLVAEIDPTATFNRTMLAEEYNQSLSTDEVYDNLEEGTYLEDEDYSIDNLE